MTVAKKKSVKKKVVKRLKFLTKPYTNGQVLYESHTWNTASVTRPAWRVELHCIYLYLSASQGTKAFIISKDHHNPKLLALFINKLINKYFKRKAGLTPEICDKIYDQVKEMIKITGDIFQPL